MASISRAQASVVARFVVGCLLLTPACLAWGLASWYPALHVFWLSLHGEALGRPPQWAGLANYGLVLQDAIWWAALGRTLLVTLVRVGVLLPAALAGLLWGQARPGWRLAVRLALTLGLALSAPVALGLLWQRASGRLPLLAGLALTEPGQAWPSYLLLEAVSFLGVGGALLATAMLALRPQPPGARPAALGVTALAMIAAAASGLDAFALPWATTGGGPRGETLTLSLYAFRTAFQQLHPGLAAAQLMPLLVGSLALGTLFGLLSERLGLRLQSVEAAPLRPAGSASAVTVWKQTALQRAARACLAVPGALALGVLILPPLLLYLFGAAETFLSAGEPLARTTTVLQVGLGLLNGIVAPGLAILLVQVPAALLAALSLSLVRPFGERGSRLAFVLLLSSGFAPATAVALGLYAAVDRAGLINTHPALAAPLLAGAASLYLFKLHFDGRRKAIDEATHLGQTAAGALWDLALRPTLGVALLAGAVAFMLAGQSPAWPLLALARSETFSLSLQLAVFQGLFAEDPAGLAAAAWLVQTLWGLGMLLVWWPLQSLVLEGWALVTKCFQVDCA